MNRINLVEFNERTEHTYEPYEPGPVLLVGWQGANAERRVTPCRCLPLTNACRVMTAISMA
jgi:hypothetical protein